MLAVFRALLLFFWLAALTIEKAVAAGGKLTAAATWSPEGVPTNTTDLQVTSTTTGNVENAAALTCRSLNFALAGQNYTHKWNWSAKVTVGGAAEAEGENAGVLLKLSAAMTVTLSGASLLVKGEAGGAITCAGQTLPAVTIEGTAKYKLADTMNLGSSTATLNRGTLELNGQRLECARFIGEGTNTKSVPFAGGYLKLTGTGNVLELNIASGAFTFGDSTGTIEVSDTSSTEKKTNVTSIVTVKPNVFIASGENILLDAELGKTLPTLQLNNARTESSTRSGLKLAEGNTYTITTITTNGKAGELAKLQSSGAGKAVVKISGEVVLDYVEIKNIEVTGTEHFYAGSHSVDGGGNKGILFRDPPVSLTRSASDSATVSDAATRTQAEPRTASDSATITEVATLLMTYARAGSDAATISDAAARIAGGERAATDSASIAEVGTRESAGARSASDSITVEDAAAVTIGSVLSASEAVNVAEAVSRTSQAERSGADSITATDAATRSTSGARSASELLHITEDVSTAGEGTRSTSDEVEVTDAARRIMHDPRSGADTISLADSPTSGAGHSRATVETVTFTDSGERLLTTIRLASDTAAIGETTTFIGSWVREPSDELNVDEATGAVFGSVVRGADSITVEDAAASFTTSTREGVDGMHVTDAATRVSVTTVYPTAIHFVNYKQARIEFVNGRQARIEFVNIHKEIAR
jgi:hypothetical protein